MRRNEKYPLWGSNYSHSIFDWVNCKPYCRIQWALEVIHRFALTMSSLLWAIAPKPIESCDLGKSWDTRESRTDLLGNSRFKLHWWFEIQRVSFTQFNFLETMDRTTAERIMMKACEDFGVLYRQDTPEDSFYQDGPTISSINQSVASEGKPEKPRMVLSRRFQISQKN